MGWQSCQYCGTTISEDNWFSEWESTSKHYKTAKCSNCGKKNWQLVNFQGSGHDDCCSQINNSIESIVKKVWEGD